jgi:tetratricopeptide (TPR) repeat protein
MKTDCHCRGMASALRTLIGTLLCLAIPLHAQRIPDPDLHETITGAIDLSGRQQYTRAAVQFDRAITQHPDHPAGYLNKAILLMVMSLDFETPVRMPEFMNLLEKTRQTAERLLARDPHSAEGLYYAGMAQSYVAYYQFRDGENWLAGLSGGLKASASLQECVNRYPDAYDAMTGLGTYKYWKSRNMSFLTWTTIVEDERAPGIRMLRTAERSALYTAAQAANSLIWIFIEEERWTDAAKEAQAMLRRYPQNRLFLWGLASAAENAGHWKLAREAYQRILASIDDEVREARYIDTQARAKVALMSFRMGDRETALRECRTVLGRKGMDLTPFTSDGRDRIARRIEEMEDLRDELR